MGQLTPNFNFEMPLNTEYYDVGTVNANMMAADTAIVKNARGYYLAAAYDSPPHLRQRADIVCNASNAVQQIQGLINSASNGDIIRFCAGTYNIYPESADGIVINKRISLIGSGINNTVFVQKGRALDPTLSGAIFKVTINNVRLEKMMLTNYTGSTDSPALVELASEGTELKELFFIQNIDDGHVDYCVKNSANSLYTRIMDCRVYRGRSVPARPMFDFSGYDFGGVISGLISSGRDGLTVRFNDETSEGNTAIYGCGTVRVLGE